MIIRDNNLFTVTVTAHVYAAQAHIRIWYEIQQAPMRK